LNLKKIFFLLLITFSTCHSYGAEWSDNSEIEKIFMEANVEGSFVLYDVTEDHFTGYNSQRANKRYIPASTFKIANSLIGLTVGAVKNVDEILPYGGKPQFLKIWEKDMSLRDAIKISNVPIYQELARRIGHAAMREGLIKLEYGNAEVGTVVDRFWLDGPIRISAIEQAEFLARLALLKLPLSQDIQKSVIDIVKLEENVTSVLYGKTGWTTASDPGIGWWVGWVERSGKIYSFALNIDMNNIEEASKRIDLGMASLKALGLL